jgi:hypothetical protein
MPCRLLQSMTKRDAGTAPKTPSYSNSRFRFDRNIHLLVIDLLNKSPYELSNRLNSQIRKSICAVVPSNAGIP